MQVQHYEFHILCILHRLNWGVLQLYHWKLISE